LCVYIYIYIQIYDICTNVSTVLPIVSVWDPRMHYKFWYIGSVLWKAWLWLNTVETCCHKNIWCNKLLCLTEIYALYEASSGWSWHLKSSRFPCDLENKCPKIIFWGGRVDSSSSSRRWTFFSWKFWPSQRPLSISLDSGRRLPSFGSSIGKYPAWCYPPICTWAFLVIF